MPLFLLSGTLIAPFATQLAKSVDAFPKGVASTQLITHSTLEGPVEKLLGWTIGNATTGDIKAILGVVVFLAFYIGIVPCSLKTDTISFLDMVFLFLKNVRK